MREVASVNAYVAMQTPQHMLVFDLVAPVFLQGRQQHVLGVVMLGKRARGAHNLHVCFRLGGHGAYLLPPELWELGCRIKVA